MSRYTSEAAAARDGFLIEHRADERRFVLIHEHERGTDPTREEIGHARYQLVGDSAIDFNGTFVAPMYRCTGLSELLAHHIVTHEITRGRHVQASCWYIDEYLARHPELTSAGASDQQDPAE